MILRSSWIREYPYHVCRCPGSTAIKQNRRDWFFRFIQIFWIRNRTGPVRPFGRDPGTWTDPTFLCIGPLGQTCPNKEVTLAKCNMDFTFINPNFIWFSEIPTSAAVRAVLSIWTRERVRTHIKNGKWPKNAFLRPLYIIEFYIYKSKLFCLSKISAPAAVRAVLSI